MPDHPLSRREFVAASTVAGLAAVPWKPLSALGGAPSVLVPRASKPVVISDYSGFEFRNGGTENAVERAFRLMTGGGDILDALIAGVNIPELDPTETGIGYGGLPNADGVVQLDASCMHGPLRRAGAVACIEGIRTPSLVARAVMDRTDHHLIVGDGAREFARDLGMTVEDDLNTERSRELWMEWRRRMDPGHWLDPDRRPSKGAIDRHEKDPGDADLAARARRAGWSMVEDGLIPEGSYWGTINCNGVNAAGDVAGVTTTSGLAWKIPGRAGDSPILGAGLYVDNDVGACGSTGRGEANLYNCSSYLVVEEMRRGRTPKDAGMAALERIRRNTVEDRLLNSRGEPNFNVRFFAVNKAGEWAGVAMYHSGETRFALCDENGARTPELEPLLEGGPGG